MKQLEMTLFSPMESSIIKMLQSKKVLSICTISANFYSGKQPVNGRNTIAGAVKKINKKCEYHKLSWFINGTGTGRGGRRVWIDKLTNHRQ